MKLSIALAERFQSLDAATAANTEILLRNDQGIEVAVRLRELDRIGCAVDEIKLTAPQIAGFETEVLTDWANDLCARLSYLVEELRVIESDAQAREILVRSGQPHRKEKSLAYFELLVQSQAGTATLKRYDKPAGEPRNAIPMELTREVAGRVVDDLADSVPQA